MSPVFRAAFKPILIFIWGYMALHIVLALVHVGQSHAPGIWMGSLAACLLWAGLVSLTEGARLWINWAAILSVLTGVWAVEATLDSADLNSYANWWPGPSAVLSCLFILYGRRALSAVLLALSFLGCLLLRLHFSGGDTGALMRAVAGAAGPVIWSVAIAGVLTLVGKLSDRQLAAEGSRLRQAVDAESTRQALSRQERNVAAMLQEAETYLRQIAELPQGEEITEAQRRQWSLGALALRDQMVSRSLLDDSLREAVKQARVRGAVVEIHDENPDAGELPAPVREAVRTAIEGVGEDGRLVLRRPPKRGAVSLLLVGPSADRWAEESLPWFPDVDVIREHELTHLTFGERLFGQGAHAG